MLSMFGFETIKHSLYQSSFKAKRKVKNKGTRYLSKEYRNMDIQNERKKRARERDFAKTN